MTSATKNTDINSTPKTYTLEDFCELTQKGCALKYFPADSIISSPNGWTTLADVWESLIDEAELDIFQDAAYCIKWGIKANGPSPIYASLIDAVCEVLLSDCPAYDAWMAHDYCKSAVFETADEFNPWCAGNVAYSYSDWHHHYTSYKMLLRILNYRKGHVTKCKKFASFVRYYESRIIKLLPNAVHWVPDYWLNENNIMAELNKVCPYDYHNDLPSYNALLDLTRSPKRMPNSRDLDIIQYISNVKNLAQCWMKAIWPTKTDAIIIQYLLLAEQRAAEALTKPWLCYSIGFYDPIPGVDYTLLSHSWIVSYTNNLLLNKSLPAGVERQVKLALFNIATHS